MKAIIKRLLTVVLCTAFALSFCLSSFALSANEYGLGLSAQAQGSGASSTLNVKLKNSNDFKVNGVCIDVTVPEGLDLQAAKAGSDGYSVLVDTLAAGEAYENSFVFVKRDSAPVSASVADENESALPAVLAVAGAVAVAAAIAVLAIRKKKAAALMLAVLMLLPCAGMFGVHAVGAEDMRSFTLNETVSISGKEYPVLLTVSYLANSAKESYFDFDVNEDTYLNHIETVTRLTTDISGVATANGAVKAVTYAVKSETTGNTETGVAQLDGCEWSIEKLALVPGENEVVITAELENGDKQTKVYNLDYDRGTLYQAKESEIREENGKKYIANVIDVYFESGVSDERMDEILSEHGLVRIGEVNSIFLVQARAKANGLAELEEICQELQSLDEVCLAINEDVVDIELNAVPNDTWYHYDWYKETWSEEVPGGNNWHVEAVEALSAWKYEKYFNKVQVGIVDSGVYVDHEDFADGLIKFPDKAPSTTYQSGNIAERHGTHVAGIIGATKNNGIGISGLLSNVEIYSAKYDLGLYSSVVTDIVNAVAAEVELGARAVNLSIGLSKGSGENGNNPYVDSVFSADSLAYRAGPCAIGMSKLLGQGKEFVVVQAAGNGTIDTRLGVNVYRSDDAVQAGLYNAVTPDAYGNYYYGKLTRSQIQQAYDRIIVAGAIRNYSSDTVGAKFYMWQRGNSGDRVDVYAPGYQVFSTSSNEVSDGQTYKYIFATGTSQAAPIVTAVAGMCFAINPNLTGAEVKSIIRNEANTTHAALDYELGTGVYDENGKELDYHPFTGHRRVVSMKLCAEAVLRTVCKLANYKFFKQVHTEALNLNPKDYKNFEVVQTILDTIDEGFYTRYYEFEQEIVTNKALELAAALAKLEERGEANYTDVEKAKAEAAELNASHYVDFSGVTNAVNAVVYGKYADEQAEVDQMAKNIRDAIAALVPAVSISPSDENIYIDYEESLVVVSPDYISELTPLLSGGLWSISHIPNSNGNYSTGSTIKLIDKNGKASDKVYTVIALGDLNSDAEADGEDAFIVKLYMRGMISADTAAEFTCCDLDFNGIIDEDDFLVLEACGLLDGYISNKY